MRICLPYGSSKLEIDLPDHYKLSVIEPASIPGLSQPRLALQEVLQNPIASPPLRSLVKSDERFEEVQEIALKAGWLFLVNVTLNKDKQITGIFCGDLVEAHARGCAFVGQTAQVPVLEPFDIVLTTNSGSPLDINLYQSVKGMSAAAQIVRAGGAIIIATECRDGVPEHGLYGQLLRAHRSPSEVLEDICASTEDRQDQWQAQLQAIVQQKARVYVYSDVLSDEQIGSALLTPSQNIEATLATLLEQFGPLAWICVLSEGPQTIPYIENAK